MEFFFNSSVDAEKSFEEKEEEEYLIQRKLEIVNQRNCIVDSIDEDRLRSAFYSYASSLSATFSFLLYVTLLFRVDFVLRVISFFVHICENVHICNL